MEKKLNSLYSARDVLPSEEVEDKIKKAKKELNDEQRKLKKKENNAGYQQKHRSKKRKQLEIIFKEDPSIKKKSVFVTQLDDLV